MILSSMGFPPRRAISSRTYVALTEWQTHQRAREYARQAQTNLTLQVSHDNERVVKRPRLHAEMVDSEVLQSRRGRTLV